MSIRTTSCLPSRARTLKPSPPFPGDLSMHSSDAKYQKNAQTGLRHFSRTFRYPTNPFERLPAMPDSIPLRHRETTHGYEIQPTFQEPYRTPRRRSSRFPRALALTGYAQPPTRLPSIIDAARIVKCHWDQILRWFESEISNGPISDVNSFVSTAKPKHPRLIG